MNIPLSPRRFWQIFWIPEDREIVLAAVTQNGEALEFAPQVVSRRGHREVVSELRCHTTWETPKVAFIGREMGP